MLLASSVVKSGLEPRAGAKREGPPERSGGKAQVKPDGGAESPDGGCLNPAPAGAVCRALLWAPAPYGPNPTPHLSARCSPVGHIASEALGATATLLLNVPTSSAELQGCDGLGGVMT